MGTTAKNRYFSPCKCPPKVLLDLGLWLNEHPNVRSSIIWQAMDGTLKPYTDWTQEEKAELQVAANMSIDGQSNLVDPPPNKVNLADDQGVLMVLDVSHAWPLYLSYVAESILMEILNKFPWSITSFTSQQLDLLFNSQKMFIYDPSNNGYEINFFHGVCLPAPPKIVRDFFYNIIPNRESKLDIIAQLLDWCRNNLWHFIGRFPTANMEDKWQYRGYPPVSRMISGTPQTSLPENGIKHRTAGCWGTVGFLRSVLRIFNIPVDLVHHTFDNRSHALPYFTTEGKYLSHGDDPYNKLSKSIPPFPAEELLINETTYINWFGPGVSEADRFNNVGRKTKELALVYLPSYLLKKHCRDLSLGNTHQNSLVLEIFARYYTVADLEAGNLWNRMDSKITSLGGCNSIWVASEQEFYEAP